MTEHNCHISKIYFKEAPETYLFQVGVLMRIFKHPAIEKVHSYLEKTYNDYDRVDDQNFLMKRKTK